MAEPAEEQVQEVTIRTLLPQSVRANISFVESRHSLQESVSDVKEALAAASQLHNVTNYSLVYKGKRITELYDDFATLEEVLGGQTGDIALQMVEKPYNLKDIYDHLARFRESIGMNFFDHAARAHGLAAGCSKFNSLGVKNIETGPADEEELAKEESSETSEPKKVTVSEEDSAAVKQIAERILQQQPVDLEAHAASDSVISKWTLPIKSLSLSQWNPVPQQQKLKGDLLYLTLTTLESEVFSITCHASGFFVNRLSNANFNPALKVNEKGVSHSEYVLYNLVGDLSPSFGKVIEQNRATIFESTQLSEYFLSPSQTISRFPWIVSEQAIKNQTVPDLSRAQLPVFSNGVDGAEIVKDWNDEFQGIKEFSRDSFNERLLREKLLNKYINDFTETAVATALEIVRDNLVPLNPNEPREKHIFLRNNIFYSFGVNATGAHDETGGDEAARYCFAKDLATVKLVNRIDTPGVCNLLFCNVDYFGDRIVCQAPVPGVFSDNVDDEGNHISKVTYGYSIDENVIRSSEKFKDGLKPIAEVLHLKPHQCELATGAKSDEELVVSKDTKGIFGTDGRKYVIDWYRTTPLDINFLDAHYDGSASSYPHREACLRHEAVEEWYKRKAAAIFKVETERLEKEGKASDEKLQVAIPHDQITFNPDAFTGVNESEEDRETVREMSEFVTKHLIPEFLDDVSKNTIPYDGAQLSDYLHRSGINIRYLGVIADEAVKKAESFKASVAKTIEENDAELKRREEEEKSKLEEEKKDEEKEKTEQTETKRPSGAKVIPVTSNMATLRTICIQEMIARAAKHVLRKQGRGVPALLQPYLVSHFHNCLLGADVNDSPKAAIDDATLSLFSSEDSAFNALTPSEVRKLVAEEVHLRYRFTLPEDWVKTIKPLLLLREIAHKFGIQWKAQAYTFSKEEFEKKQAPEQPKEQATEAKGKKGKKKQVAAVQPSAPKRTTTFIPEDIVAFVPLIKDSSYRCTFVDEIFETAKAQIREENKQVGMDLLAELLSFYQQIYGAVHHETCDFYSTLAQIYSENKMNAEACVVARKATILQERLSGTDSYETISNYTKSSFLDSLNGDYVSAFKLTSKAFADWSVIYGADHPNTINTFCNLGSILQDIGLSAPAKQFYEKALALSIELNGELSEVTAVVRHRLGVLHVQTGDYKSGLEQFKTAGDNFSRLVGPDDTFTKECVNFAKNLGNYMAYSEHQKAEKKKLLAQEAKAAAQASAKAASKSKNGKKAKKTVVADPDLPSKSVDEILQFIEGSNQKSNKKLKK